MENDWQSGKSLVEANLHLLNNQLLSDITFVFPKLNEEAEVIYSHKLMLSKRSAVFFTMFHQSQPETKEVIVEDTSKDCFLVFLEYLYTEIVEITYLNVVELSYLADKYLITKLSLICNEFKIRDSKTVFAILEKCMDYSSHALTNRCLKVISKSTLQTMSCETWLYQPKSVVKKILELDTVNCEEIVLFRLVLK